MKKEKIGIIDVGGGMRDIYGAGIFDYLIDKRIDLDYTIGVSAGSANIASYLSKQKGRNKVYYLEYSFEKDYMSLRNYIKTGSFFNFDYIYGTLSNSDGKYPWDYDKAMKSSKEMVVVTTDAKSGKPVYFYKKDFKKNDYGMLKASCSIPIVCKAYKWNDNYYYDGALSDPIPFKKAFEDGCDRVIVILTRSTDYRKKTKHTRFFKKLNKKYPNMVEKLYSRCDIYNRQLEELLEKYVPSGKAFVIGPNNLHNVDTIRRKKENLEKLYNEGYKDGKKIEKFLKENKLI